MHCHRDPKSGRESNTELKPNSSSFTVLHQFCLTLIQRIKMRFHFKHITGFLMPHLTMIQSYHYSHFGPITGYFDATFNRDPAISLPLFWIYMYILHAFYCHLQQRFNLCCGYSKEVDGCFEPPKPLAYPEGVQGFRSNPSLSYVFFNIL